VNVGIISIYKSPKCPINIFIEMLENALNKFKHKTCTNMFIVGDFNVDFFSATTERKILFEFMDKHKLLMTNKQEISTDKNSLVDMCFSRIIPDHCHFIESVISDHKPIWFTIN